MQSDQSPILPRAFFCKSLIVEMTTYDKVSHLRLVGRDEKVNLKLGLLAALLFPSRMVYRPFWLKISSKLIHLFKSS